MLAKRLPWSLNGGTVVTTMIAQCTVSISQRKHQGGTREADASLRLKGSVCNKRMFYEATIGSSLHTCCKHLCKGLCLPFASFELPLASNTPPRWLVCDYFEHAQNLSANLESFALSEHFAYHLWTTKASTQLLPRFQRRSGQFYGRTRELKCCGPCVKGALTI